MFPSPVCVNTLKSCFYVGVKKCVVKKKKSPLRRSLGTTVLINMLPWIFFFTLFSQGIQHVLNFEPVT